MSIPPDNPQRRLTLSNPLDPGATHFALAGGIYTLLVRGSDTEGKYCLIEMRVPPGGGPPPHRHDFEEMFTVLEGEIELTFRDETRTAKAGDTVNIPANARHAFKNVSRETARLLCVCAPAGQDEYFLLVGDPLASLDSPPPALTEEERVERREKAVKLAPKFLTEF